jgi:hypothetical protein
MQTKKFGIAAFLALLALLNTLIGIPAAVMAQGTLYLPSLQVVPKS